MLPQLLLFAACCGAAVPTAHGAKLLFLMPLGTKSHMNFFGTIATILADQGHQITTVSSYSLKHHPNITEIDVNVPMENFMHNSFEYRKMQAATYLLNQIPSICVEALGKDEVQNLNVENYDLVFMSVLMNDCFLFLLDGTDVPLIYMNPNIMTSVSNDLIGNVDFPSFTTTLSLPFIHPFTFIERLENTLYSSMGVWGIIYYHIPRVVSECKRVGICPENMQSLENISSRASMIFINSVRTLEVPPRPHFPGVITAGGLNCRPAKSLPQDLESWIQDSGEAGFIYMSMGSIVKASDMPEQKRKILMEVFGSLPQRVLWKWDQETMENLPPNVRLSKWLPQQDILGHPKLKVFITHGGLFSVLEAVYHGVPILGMPVFYDQFTNIAQSEAEGFAERVEWEDLTVELFEGKLTKLITDDSYADVVKQRSVVMRDQPMSPQDTIIYWTGYALRHRGVPHLRSPLKEMPWYKLYNVDVWIVILVGLMIVLLLLLTIILKSISFLMRRCLRLFRTAEPSTQVQKKKKTQ